MMRDRDRIFGIVVTRRLRAVGIRDKPTAPASPWQDGFAERLIGSIRRECLDHVIVLGEPHPRRVLKSFPSQRCTALSLGTARQCHQFTRYLGQTSSPLWSDFVWSDFGFSVHTGIRDGIKLAGIAA
jgi:transposase InsO family protein